MMKVRKHLTGGPLAYPHAERSAYAQDVAIMIICRIMTDCTASLDATKS